MSTIPKTFIDDLLNRTDIVDIIDSFIKLKKQGRNYVACCPFHHEKTPSFSVSPAKQIYHCFGCGVGGNVISFLIDYDHLHFVEAIEELARRAGVTVPREQTTRNPVQQDDYQALAFAANYYQSQLKKNRQASTATNYLKNRGLSGKTAKRFAIGFAPPGWDNLLKAAPDAATLQSWKNTGMVISNEKNKTYDRFRNRIIFPIRDRRGQFIGFGGRILDPNDSPKYLNSSESNVFHKSQTLYGIYEMLQQRQSSDYILIVEGYMDVIMLAEHGIHHVVATLGTATTAEHIQQLLRLSKRLIFCFDGDTAGRTAAWRALEASLVKVRDDSDIRFLFLPDGEDPDSYVCQQGKNAFLALVDQSIGLAEYFIQHLAQTHDQQNMAGKSALLTQASQLLQNMSHIHLKAMIMDELAKLLHLPSERLPQLMRQSQKLAKTTPNQDLNNLPPNLRKMLALLLQDPKLVSEIPESLNFPATPPWDLLASIVATLKSRSIDNTANLLEIWRDSESYDLLLKLANWQHPIPEDGVATEFCALIKHLAHRYQNQELNELLRTAKNRTLSQADRERLAYLIAQKQLKNSEKNS